MSQHAGNAGMRTIVIACKQRAETGGVECDGKHNVNVVGYVWFLMLSTILLIYGLMMICLMIHVHMYIK